MGHGVIRYRRQFDKSRVLQLIVVVVINKADQSRLYCMMSVILMPVISATHWKCTSLVLETVVAVTVVTDI